MTHPLTPVDSSFVQAIGYDKTTLEIHVLLRTGQHYVYQGWTLTFYRRLMKVQSKGAYLNNVIKPYSVGCYLKGDANVA